MKFSDVSRNVLVTGCKHVSAVKLDILHESLCVFSKATSNGHLRNLLVKNYIDKTGVVTCATAPSRVCLLAIFESWSS